MKLSEKMIELNFCSELSLLCGGALRWFGLTQRQEAQAGFDACTKLGGRLAIFQFKASSRNVASPLLGLARRFEAPHPQLLNLQHRCRPDRQIYYVFPSVGTTLELHRAWVSLSSWFLDVSQLPALLPAPTTAAGTLRKNQRHYIDVDMVSGNIVIHSEPTRTSAVSVFSVLEGLGEGREDTVFENDF